MGTEVVGIPGAGLVQWTFVPAIAALARNSHSDEEAVRNTLARLPELLDHVDALIAAGTIGGERPNAADFQILSGCGAVRVRGSPAAPPGTAVHCRRASAVGPIPPGLPDFS